ncbi:MAG: vWA domain-containing protein [Eubacterium sp.]|nr:vWA domain-containing protein [Eubacterium sp.]
MKKGLTELVFIIDRSGSMAGLEEDTIGGFNSLLKRQGEEKGDAYVSVVLFDDETEVLYDRVDIRKIEPMNGRQYYVRGCTALLDALGAAIHHIGSVHKYARKEDVPEKTLFIITTDGQENASREYSYEKVRKMVERQQEKYGWEFLFLGANMDAIRTASRFGIRSSRAVNYESDSEGTRLNYEVMSKVVSCARIAETAAEMNAAFDSEELLEPIRSDYKKRHRK